MAAGRPAVVVRSTSASPAEPPPVARAAAAPCTWRASATAGTAPSMAKAVRASALKGAPPAGVVGQCWVVVACGSPAAVSASKPRCVGGVPCQRIAAPPAPARLVGLSAEEGRDVEILLGRVGRAGRVIAADLGEPAPPRGRARGGVARRLREIDDLARRLARLPLLCEPGGDDRHADLVLEGRVDHGAEDDVGVVVRRLLNDPGGLVDLMERQVGPAREVDQDPARALDRRLI